MKTVDRRQKAEDGGRDGSGTVGTESGMGWDVSGTVGNGRGCVGNGRDGSGTDGAGRGTVGTGQGGWESAGFGFAFGAEFFADAGGAAAEFSEVVEFGAADVAVADDFDVFHEGRAGLEGSLHRFAGGHAADDEGFVDAASASGDDDAFKELAAAGGAFGDADAHGDGVAGGERGEVSLQSRGFLALQFFNDIHCFGSGVGLGWGRGFSGKGEL